MHIVVAVDKFKGSLTSFEAGDAIRTGIKQADAQAAVTVLPMADGGDGLLDVLAHYIPCQKQYTTVLDPLFRPVAASYLRAADGQTAIIEMAAASGLRLLQPSEYNCNITSSYGTGQLIKEAIQSGAKKLIVGIGGSATNDGGMGMAAALGYTFLDAQGEALQPIGENLIHIRHIDTSGKIDLTDVEMEVACDVTNYLTGEQGAAYVYAPQKGASAEDVQQLEAGMQHFAAIVQQELGKDITTIPGGGAAGGMGAGCVAFLDAKLVKGIDLVLQYSHAATFIQQADLVITGEGKIDASSLQGKVINGIAALCHQYGKPLIALCGTLAIEREPLQQAGITAAFSILPKPMSLEEACREAAHLLTGTAYAIAALCGRLRQ